MDAAIKYNTSNDIEVARRNREIIEAADRLDLGEGLIQVDQAPSFKWGAEITGHRNGSIIQNDYYTATYALNTCGMLVGRGIDYINGFERLDDTVIRCPNAVHYHNDNCLYFWVWDGYMKPSGQNCTRNQIVNINKQTFEVHLKDPLPKDVEFSWVKLLDCYECADYPAGQGFIETPFAAQFKTRKEAFFTMGPVQANECFGQYIDIVGVDLDKGRVYLREPIPMAFTQCALVKVRTAKRNVFNNVTFGVPAHHGSHSFFGTQLRDAHFNDCKALWGPFGFGNSEGLVMTGTQGSIALNQAIRSWIMGSAYNVAYEEGCYDNVISSATLFNPFGGQHGIYANGWAPCGRFRFMGLKLANFGFDPGNGHGSPFAGPFHDSTMKDIEIFGTWPGAQSYTGGDNLQVENLKTDTAISFGSSENVNLNNVRGPVVWLGWNNDHSSGRAYGCRAILYGGDRSRWNVTSCEELVLRNAMPPLTMVDKPDQLFSEYRRLSIAG